MLNRYRFDVELKYVHRLLFTTVISLFNEMLSWIEYFIYSRTILETEIHPQPIFILGHPRSGTTVRRSVCV